MRGFLVLIICLLAGCSQHYNIDVQVNYDGHLFFDDAMITKSRIVKSGDIFVLDSCYSNKSDVYYKVCLESKCWYVPGGNLKFFQGAYELTEVKVLESCLH